MTRQQKEEYNYKFKDQPVIIRFDSLVILIILFMAIVQGLMVVSLLIYDEADRVPALKPYGDDMMIAAAYYMSMGAWIVMISLIGYLGQIVYSIVMERKWIKDNNIVVISRWRRRNR